MGAKIIQTVVWYDFGGGLVDLRVSSATHYYSQSRDHAFRARNAAQAEMRLDTTALLWSAAVVRDGRHVTDGCDANAQCAKSAH